MGRHIFEILNDLSKIKVSPADRVKVLYLKREFAVRSLNAQEDLYLRRLEKRYQKKIKELHQSFENVRMTDAKMRLGSKNFKRIMVQAEEKTRERRIDRLAKAKAILEKAKKESSDFGF